MNKIKINTEIIKLDAFLKWAGIDFKNATEILETKSHQCEDTIKMYFVFDEKNVLVDVKYQVFGCWAVIVSCSMMSEYILGKTRDEIKNISEKEMNIDFEYVQEIKERCFYLIKNIFEQL